MNVKNALRELPEPTVYGWLDGTVALHWILGNGQYHQFVVNRVHKIKEHLEIKWRHVRTLDNPADLASRGGLVTRFTRIALADSRKNDTHRTGYQPVIVYYSTTCLRFV